MCRARHCELPAGRGYTAARNGATLYRDTGGVHHYGLVIGPNVVFIIPVKRDLHVLNAAFRMRPISRQRESPNAITLFMHALKRHWNGELTAVLVSGYGGDGAAVLCGINVSPHDLYNIVRYPGQMRLKREFVTDDAGDGGE